MAKNPLRQAAQRLNHADVEPTPEWAGAELVLGPGPVPWMITVSHPEPPEGQSTEPVGLVVVAWVLDQDGTGCAVLALPNGQTARLDRLEHDGWRVVGSGPITTGGPRIVTPGG